jgi:hypothetical protein
MHNDSRCFFVGSWILLALQFLPFLTQTINFQYVVFFSICFCWKENPLLLYKASVSNLGAGHTSLPSKSKREAKAAILLQISLDFDGV